MIGIVIATHRRLADELLATAREIMGEIPQASSVCFQSSDPVDTQHGRLEAAIAKADSGDGVIVLTDMFGGTPSNVALSLMASGKVEVLSGASLPMLLKLSTAREGKLADIARDVKLHAQRNITLASELLSK